MGTWNWGALYAVGVRLNDEDGESGQAADLGVGDIPISSNILGNYRDLAKGAH